MLPLYDMLANAQNGEGVAALSRQFGLSEPQTRQAMDALLPAFSQGLKRNAADPFGVGAFMSALAGGRHAPYFDDAARAASPEGTAEGNAILGHLFGSPELSRAVASQAAQATGLADETMRRMLPVLAAMIMGGIYRQTTTPPPNAGTNPLSDLMNEMMRQSGATLPRQPDASPNPFDNPFTRALQSMFGAGTPAAASRERPAPDPYADNPLGRIFEDMMGGGRREAEAEPPPPTNPSGRPRNTYDDLFGQMFETGRQTRDEYRKSMESVFDTYLKGMDRHR